MNGFKKKSITPKKKKIKKWIRGHLLLSAAILLLAVLGIKGIVGAFNVGNPFSVKQIVISAVSNPIETDDHGNTNILLIGVGGEGHDGENLTDTMIVASIDYKGGLVSMLSIPRDIYVDNEMVGWGTRINSVYEYVAENNDYDYALAMNELRSEIERITGVDLHYYAKIDFEGFVDIVDAIGGITVDVEEEIYDIAYPADPGSAYLYQTFYLEAGEQELDGETALKYVRSRHTSSDFDRARRQQEVLNAVKNKALSIGFLLNPVKIKNTLSVLADNFETDLTLTEMMNFASLASDFSGDSIVSAVLSDDIWSAGGFLYPPEREYYGGAYVLIPYTGPEDFSEVHTFCDLLFHHPEVIADQVSIQILNATGVSGLAGMNYYHLTRYGFNVVDTENALNQDLATTRIFPSGESNAFTEETSEALNYLLLGEILDTAPEEYALWETDAELIIELGTDFYEYYTANEDLFYYEFLY